MIRDPDSARLVDLLERGRQETDREHTGTHFPAAKNPPGWLGYVVLLLFALTPLLFAARTGNAWEDYYITFRASKNLAAGHGLVFTEGERIHSFTSPLGTLIPALCSVVAGPDHDALALWLFRLVSAAAFGLAGVLICLTLRKAGLSTVPLGMTLALLALDAKSVMYSSNGMETAFMLFFLSLSLCLLTVETKRPVLYLGLAWGGVMWTRPDGFIYAGALAVSFLVFKAGVASAHSRVWLLKQFLSAGILAALVYAPWLFWAWSYYGSPIPHTVIAKGLTQAHRSAVLMTWSEWTWDRFCQVVWTFTPAYMQFGGWDPKLALWGLGLWALAALPLVLPKTSRYARAVSAAFIASCVYLFWITPLAYPWYIPNGAWMGYVAIGLLFHQGCTHGPFRSVRLAGVTALIIPQTVLLCLVVQQIAAQQRIVETGSRKAIGLWLKGHASSPHDTVFVECLGYIGYYSNLKMYDFPGLASEEVVAARRRLGTDKFAELIKALHPDWLVLRPWEIAAVSGQDRRLLNRDYQVATVFDCSKRVAPLCVAGKAFLVVDQIFTIFHRRAVLEP